ncbi:hypothetical protein [Massilia sp. Se16.2.3]|uniref:hypothetical protein n=1 Tax=Massilia sp. Se16.2.3 TaxID=2709303 RepID=UPI001602530E|nr:hypothetical protein [Massilia sp. Se16.2.3]QNA97562.1 hypothetical protein G4G31_14820 [Massilia sp. Se16.2.3]
MKKTTRYYGRTCHPRRLRRPWPGPANYGTRGYAQAADPNGWQVVSVTPVPLGTGARAGDAGVVTSSNVFVNPAPAPVVGVPVYVPQPVYPAPVYEPYWYPPVSIGLGLSFGRSWGGHRHRGHFRRR